MSVLILGARGMLGSMLAKVLAVTQDMCWDQEQLDITDQTHVRHQLEKVRPEIIINAAAFTDVDGAQTNQLRAFAVNRHGPGNVAVAARRIGATLVHYSTDYVFPGTKAVGYGENDRPGPAVNIYGQSKLAGEEAVQSSGASSYILRTAWLYGPNGRNFVDTMLKLAQQHSSLSAVNDQFGNPTFTYDVAQATQQIIEGDYQPGVYHVVNEGVVTWYEFAREIFRLSRVDLILKPVSSEQFPRPAKRPQYSILLNTMGPKLRSWQEALQEYLSAWRERN